jgi:type IV pilus assembly protein PilY1
MRTGYFGSTVKLAAVCALSLVGFSNEASAQNEPDLRDPPPFVMVVADTSGSMEWLPNCQCPPTSPSCTCYPDCNLSNNAFNVAPPGKKNRWAMLLEALTGTFTNFQCEPLQRTDSTRFTYDYGYSKPFHRPWVCPGGATYCDYPGTETVPIQMQNGLLDNYANRIRFGLATFDGMRTWAGKGDLVFTSEFSTTLSDGKEGSYSYAGPKAYQYPTCGRDHMIDSGIRNRAAPEGGLISIDTNPCAQTPCDPAVVSAAIQKSLLSTRTFGGTPTGSALDDLYWHFKNDFTDPMQGCRKRYAVLITDGYPDDDFREYPVPGCDCAARGNCPTDENPLDMRCPYPTAVQAAYDLKNGRTTPTSTDTKQLDQLYVVGMSIADNESRVGLNAIASAGGSVDEDHDGNEAFFADDPSTLTATLDGLLGKITKTISRSVPAFATGKDIQYQVSAGFKIASDTMPAGFAPPWIGVLDRRRYLCNGKEPEPVTLADQDQFDVLLNKQVTRSLWTAIPGAPTNAVVEGKMDRIATSSVCGSTGCDRTELTSVPIELFGSIDTNRRTVLLDWMYGNPGSVRAKYKLGDIYHSSPAIVGPPTEDPGDQSYTLFRESTLIDQRPRIMYVNTNDGILHAFALEDHQVTGSPTTYKGGQELWGFVPPLLLDNLNSQISAHRLNLDGTPVIKDVYFSKTATPAATDYKSVLISGMRSGGNAYFALDVTDPATPKFMWQFTDEDMGDTYGQPEIVQARYSWPPGQAATVRAMAILSGGRGSKEAGPGCNTTNNTTRSFRVPNSTTDYTTRSETSLTSAELRHRSEVQCWGRKGRAMFFVDVETGRLIKKVFDTDNNVANGIMFPSPLIGSPTAYQDTVGTLATEGFVVDADGVVWRIDLTATDPRPDDALNGWTLRPFHDIFWDKLPPSGETSYEKPILSLDKKHQLIILLGTGDTDNFEKPGVQNRVVSLTELPKVPTPKGPADYQAALNWELRADDAADAVGLVSSELVTGTMSLFDEQLYLASFISYTDATDACAFGAGRLWSVHFTDRDTTSPNQGGLGNALTYPPKRIPVGTGAEKSLFNVAKTGAEQNLLILGLGATQRQTCNAKADNLGDNYYAPAGSLVSIKQEATPSIWIVAQASRKLADGQTSIGNSRLNTVEVKMSRPLEFSQVSAWAGSIE